MRPELWVFLNFVFFVVCCIAGEAFEVASDFKLPLRLELPIGGPLILTIVILVGRVSLKLSTRYYLIILISHFFSLGAPSGFIVCRIGRVPLKFPPDFELPFRPELLPSLGGTADVCLVIRATSAEVPLGHDIVLRQRYSFSPEAFLFEEIALIVRVALELALPYPKFTLWFKFLTHLDGVLNVVSSVSCLLLESSLGKDLVFGLLKLLGPAHHSFAVVVVCVAGLAIELAADFELAIVPDSHILLNFWLTLVGAPVGAETFEIAPRKHCVLRIFYFLALLDVLFPLIGG